MKNKIENLYNSDNDLAYNSLLELEIISTESDEVYNYFDNFLDLINSNETLKIIRGFRLICSVAKYDKLNKINDNIDIILKVFDSDNGIVIRQCLKYINQILLYKIELNDCFEFKLRNMYILKYKSSMQSLIKKDIDDILSNM